MHRSSQARDLFGVSGKRATTMKKKYFILPIILCSLNFFSNIAYGDRYDKYDDCEQGDPLDKECLRDMGDFIQHLSEDILEEVIFPTYGTKKQRLHKAKEMIDEAIDLESIENSLLSRSMQSGSRYRFKKFSAELEMLMTYEIVDALKSYDQRKLSIDSITYDSPRNLYIVTQSLKTKVRGISEKFLWYLIQKGDGPRIIDLRIGPNNPSLLEQYNANFDKSDLSTLINSLRLQRRKVSYNIDFK